MSRAEQSAPLVRPSWRGGRAEGMALLLVTACSWGLNWPLMKFLLTELPPFWMRAISGLSGVGFALVLVLARRESLRVPHEQIGNLVLFSILNYGAFGIFTVLALF